MKVQRVFANYVHIDYIESQKHKIFRNQDTFLVQNVNISKSFKLCSLYLSRSEVNAINFDNCTFAEFPRAQILDFIPNVASLLLYNCNIIEISRLDLQGFKSLKELYMGFNAIEKLPKGLFDFTPNLEIVSFQNNQINEIHAGTLSPLKKLKYFDLENNALINVKYDAINQGFSYQGYSFSNTGNVNFVQLKEAIKQLDPKEKFKAQTQNGIELLNSKVDDLEKKIELLKTQVDDLKNEVEKHKMDNEDLKKKNAAIEAEITKLKALPNFTVSIDGKTFRVDKELLMANSPVLDKLIRDKGDADHLELTDISSDTFKDILNFMRTKNLPSNATNLIELFTASARLEMKELMDSTAEILMEKVTSDNAPDIIKLCKKYNHEQLNKKAYDELFKNYPK